jgi:hypothetical protein
MILWEPLASAAASLSAFTLAESSTPLESAGSASFKEVARWKTTGLGKGASLVRAG